MRFLLGVATLAVAVALAGCGGGDTSDEATTGVGPPAAPDSSGSPDAVDQQRDERSSPSNSKPSGEGSRDEQVRSKAAKRQTAGKATGENGESRSAQNPVDQDPPDVPAVVAEARKKLEEVEALNERLLNPPPGKTTQEVVEEIQEEIRPNP